MNTNNEMELSNAAPRVYKTGPQSNNVLGSKLLEAMQAKERVTYVLQWSTKTPDGTIQPLEVIDAYQDESAANRALLAYNTDLGIADPMAQFKDLQTWEKLVILKTLRVK